MAKYLKHKIDGFIYPWTEILAKNPILEEVTEVEAFPEKFIPAKAKTRRRKAKVTLDTVDIPEKPSHISEELADEASRGLPK